MNVFCFILLIVTVVFAPIPLVLSIFLLSDLIRSNDLVSANYFRPNCLYPPIQGTLIMKSGQWYYNDSPFVRPVFTLYLSEWCIGIRDQNGARFILWRSSCDESAYRHFVVTIKKQSRE